MFFSQIFTDFLEIRQEIEAETERGSGDNKVKKGLNVRLFIKGYLQMFS